MQPETLLSKYGRLVEVLARSIYRAFDEAVELDELISIGVEGLLRAAARVDPVRRDRFGGYVYLRVRGAMIDNLGRAALTPRAVYRRLRAGRLTAHTTPREPRMLDELEPDDPPGLDADDLRALRDAVSELPERWRAVLVAIYAEGASTVEIAQRTGVSPSAISKRHHRALARLRERLDPPDWLDAGPDADPGG